MIKELLEKLKANKDERKALNEAVEKRDGQAYTDDEEKRYIELEAQAVELNAKIEAAQKTQERKTELEKTDAQIRSIESTPATPEIVTETRETATNVTADVNAENRQAEALDLYLRSGGHSTEAAKELRDLQSTTGGGAVLIPTLKSTGVVEELQGKSALRQICQVVQLSGDTEFPVSKALTGGQITAEGAATPKDTQDPLFEVQKLEHNTFVFNIHVTRKLLEDSAYPLVEMLNRQIARRFAALEEVEFVKKLRETLTEGKKSSSKVDLLYDDLVDLKQSVNAAYDTNGTFLISQDSEGRLLKMKATNGIPIYQPNIAQGRAATILGRRLAVSSGMQDVGASNTTGIYGDFSTVVISDLRQFFAIEDIYTQAAKDMVVFVVSKRSGILATDLGAVKALNAAA